MESNTIMEFVSLSLCWFISTIIISICKTGTRRREYINSIKHRRQMAKLAQLRRLRMDVGRGEEFDELYAQERSKREESSRKRHKKHNKQEVKGVERINVERIRDLLRKRLKSEKSDRQDQQRYDTAKYRDGRIDHLSDKSSSKRGMDDYKNRSDRHLQEMRRKVKKPTKFQAKLRELSMSPRTKRKKELESLRSETTQEVSSGDTDNLKKSSKTFATVLKNKPPSEEESKTGTESIKEDRSSWLFKSPKERKKQLLQQQLELRRLLREKMISLRRQKLNSKQKIAANKLLASPKRLEESLLTARPDDTSTARLDEISTTHIDQVSHKSQGIKNRRKSYRTARNIVEEDLRKRLQQMDFKLTPEKILQTKSERSITAISDRSPNNLSASGNRPASGSKSQRELSSRRRMRHQKSESETTEKSCVRRKLKHKKLINDERRKRPLKKIANLQKNRKTEEQQNFTKPSKYQVKIEEKSRNQAEKFFKNKENIKEELKKSAKSMNKQSSKVSSKTSNNNNAPTERSNQKSIKMHSTLSKDKKLKKNKFNDKKSMNTRKTTETQKSTGSTTCTDSSKSCEGALNKSSRNPDRVLNNITRPDVKETSDKRSSISRPHSKRNQKKSKKHLNLINASTEAIISDKISSNQPMRANGRNMLQFRKRKLDSSSLSNKSSISEASPENSSVNQKTMEKFRKKRKMNHAKKLRWEKTTKSKGLGRDLSSNSNGIYTSIIKRSLLR
ncbi:hypothetical protein ACO02O_05155 [Dirofilaria immitis]